MRGWRDTGRFPCTSQGHGPVEQPYIKFGNNTQDTTFVMSHDTGASCGEEGVDKKDKPTFKEVAWVKRGDRVAQVTWEEGVFNQSTFTERVLALPHLLYDYAVRGSRKVLRSKLQNESKTAKVVGIERGRCAITYNLDVVNTHCLVIDGGVIAHNSMDALRYGLANLLTLDRGYDPLDELRVWANRQRTQIR